MVVDTSAVFAIVFGEPEQGPFAEMITAAEHRLLGVATAVECVAVLARRRPTPDPMIAMNLIIQDLGLEIIPMDEAQWRAASDALIRFGRGRHPARLNLGDSFAYALAKVTGEPLLFKGGDFFLTDVIPAA